MDHNQQAFLTTHNAPSEIKEFLKIQPKPTTQVRCIPLKRMKEGGNQTDKAEDECYNCKHKAHLILQKLAYILTEAYENILKTSSPRGKLDLRWSYPISQHTANGYTSFNKN